MKEMEALRTRLFADGSLILDVKAVPRSSRSEIAGRMGDGTLKIKIAAVPEKGKANAELCRFLAECFQVPVRNVRVLTGLTAHRKRVLIGVS